MEGVSDSLPMYRFQIETSLRQRRRDNTGRRRKEAAIRAEWQKGRLPCASILGHREVNTNPRKVTWPDALTNLAIFTWPIPSRMSLGVQIKFAKATGTVWRCKKKYKKVNLQIVAWHRQFHRALMSAIQANKFMSMSG